MLRYQALPHPPPRRATFWIRPKRKKTKIHLNYLTSPDLIQWDNTHPYIHITQAQRNSRWQMYSHTHTQTHTYTTLKNNKEVGRRKLTICSNISCFCCSSLRQRAVGWQGFGCCKAVGWPSLFFTQWCCWRCSPRSLLWCCGVVGSGGRRA